MKDDEYGSTVIPDLGSHYTEMYGEDKRLNA
jgi:hypothetical protein